MYDRPDIVFFMLDQLAAKWIELAESAGVCDLANLRRLRQGGTTFDRAFCSSPLCCPARASLATGLQPRAHGVIEIGYRLNPAIPTFMRALRDAGWRTGAFGKVHLRPNFYGTPDNSVYGFEVNHITEDSRDGEWLEWIHREHPEHFDAVLSTAGLFALMPGSAAFGPDRINLRERIKTLSGGSLFAPDGPLPFPEVLSQSNWITDRAIDFINETPATAPLYAHVSYVQPHGPFTPPEGYRERINVNAIPEPAPAEWEDDPHAPAAIRAFDNLIDEHWRETRAYYFADLLHLDTQLGRLHEALERRGKLDNTHVIFVADHGELLLDHGLRHKEHKHYDACIRIPLYWSGPEVQANTRTNALVQLEDICPTIFDLMELPLPQPPTDGWLRDDQRDELPCFYGRSLRPLLEGTPADDWRDGVFIESYNGIVYHDTSEWARTIRTSRHRYTYFPDGGAQLFDLHDDPDEQHNLIGDPATLAMQQELQTALLNAVILQDLPKPPRDLVRFGVH